MTAESEACPIEIRIIEFDWAYDQIASSALTLNPGTANWTPNRIYSCAGYCLNTTGDAVADGSLQVRTRFYRNDGSTTSVYVRTVIEPSVGSTGQPAAMAPLGTVASTLVPWDANTGFSTRFGITMVDMALENVCFPAMGIGAYDFTWRWEYSENGQDDWKTIQTTAHRVFVTFDQPAFPWTTWPQNLRPQGFAAFPWIDALELACRWAAGTKTTHHAASAIADALFDCGVFSYSGTANYYLSYTNPSTGESQHHFALNELIDRVNGGTGLGSNINCEDCAHTVMALANVLGCKLEIGKLQGSDNTDVGSATYISDNQFEVNPIRAIGKADWADTQVLLGSGAPYCFVFHMVAWEPESEEAITLANQADLQQSFTNNKIHVYDACLQVQDGRDETTYHSISGKTLGDPDTPDHYRTLLAADTDQGAPRCNPQPATVRRVPIY